MKKRLIFKAFTMTAISAMALPATVYMMPAQSALEVHAEETLTKVDAVAATATSDGHKAY